MWGKTSCKADQVAQAAAEGVPCRQDANLVVSVEVTLLGRFVEQVKDNTTQILPNVDLTHTNPLRSTSNMLTLEGEAPPSFLVTGALFP